MTTAKTTIRLHELCECLQVPVRHVRYVLEKGFLPQGVEEAPNSGNHRQFDAAQAFWLAILLKLKENGIATPLAAEITGYAYSSVRTVTQNLGWEPQFMPHLGRLQTKHDYYIEIADHKYIR